jgi:hypothetical protein
LSSADLNAGSVFALLPTARCRGARSQRFLVPWALALGRQNEAIRDNLFLRGPILQSLTGHVG